LFDCDCTLSTLKQSERIFSDYFKTMVVFFEGHQEHNKRRFQMSQNIFKRYEKKYMLTPQQYRFLREHLQGRMKIDEYGLHTICSIYFDTDDYALIRASLQKPVYKEKLRLRSYGIPSSCDETVF